MSYLCWSDMVEEVMVNEKNEYGKNTTAYNADCF